MPNKRINKYTENDSSLNTNAKTFEIVSFINTLKIYRANPTPAITFQIDQTHIKIQLINEKIIVTNKLAALAD